MITESPNKIYTSFYCAEVRSRMFVLSNAPVKVETVFARVMNLGSVSKELFRESYFY